MIFVDSNILLDIITDDPIWYDWSIGELDKASLVGPLYINDVVYAEISVRYQRIEDLDEMLVGTGVSIISIPRAALFLAGKVFDQYRKAGGTRTGVLPDFFIGSHATVSGLSVLTRDTKRFQTYFKSVTLISPPTV
ncbi:type II toxin-antitoxin system VapC family toxin [Rhizobium sp. LEGMi198b]|uniref:type II toxin-antitoxin system VapC family toxin n=1 Tax=unclassified Rhizobium TaxID=2613769 RepID=UPI000CDF395D|nr:MULTISPECIES: type II toxin-antitoxin system VapC family toxin [Rhizobium]AVA23447.1 PilT domain-containing protein [Rhizobium sp. NXC24]MDK4739559.1 type II toxin-antitoxin system VapC family toxin [Rhizobium sp. CNPSo 3464]UWU23371.1 type II toxin-antitoxin system VapC family toxin [Rhizobium tropici]